MPIVTVGMEDPEGRGVTSTNLRAARPPLCKVCGKRREDELYTVNVYGQVCCATGHGPALGKPRA